MTVWHAGPARRVWMAPLGWESVGSPLASGAPPFRFVPPAIACIGARSPASIAATYEQAANGATR